MARTAATLVVLAGIAALAPVGGAIAATETILHSFTGGIDGAYPYSGLVHAQDGGFYCAPSGGGAFGFGTLAKVLEDGAVAVLYNFRGTPEGARQTWLSADRTGTLYAATYLDVGPGGGRVLRFAPPGHAKLLHEFGALGDGVYPNGALAFDRNLNVFGTTLYGGASNAGAVFLIAASGTETVLYSFSGGADGYAPNSGVIRDFLGNLYGVTEYGGAAGMGAVFRLSPDGHESVLHSFNGQDEGRYPQAGLVAGRDGTLYGTTSIGDGNAGVVFKLTPAGQFTVLHRFSGGVDGSRPASSLLLDGGGTLYGTTEFGGTSGDGVLFKLAPSGSETVLHSFGSGMDGTGPDGNIIMDRHGAIFGTTVTGGSAGMGIVFRIAP
jgi:uncharacterized repeat protein (TIGR03803 family)